MGYPHLPSATAEALRLRLPGQPEPLAARVDRTDLPRLAGALVRAALDAKAAADLTGPSRAP